MVVWFCSFAARRLHGDRPLTWEWWCGPPEADGFMVLWFFLASPPLEGDQGGGTGLNAFDSSPRPPPKLIL